MSDQTEEEKETAKKKGRKRAPLFILVILLVASGGGGFLAVSKGLIPLPEKAPATVATDTSTAGSDVAFVPLEPLIITLGRDAKNSHLRFNAQLEVVAEYEAEVARLEPRFLDVLNGYLQALEARDIENPEAFIRMRAQMLRRMQVVAGEGRVRDLLVTEFVLN
jgi:flagellar FliL protein